MAISDAPFNNEPSRDNNRVRRITFCIGSVKTAAHVTHPTGSKERYEKVRDDSSDPKNVQTPLRDDYITEED